MESENKQKIHVFAMINAVLIPLLIGGFSAFLTSEDMKAYGTMNKPPLAPPAWLFPIVWTILYVLVGIASYLVYVAETDRERKRSALLIYASQLVMNFFWSTLFFTYGQYLISFMWLIAMWVLIIICVVRFYRIRPAAGYLMGVLFLWTSFAAYLNAAYYLLSITPMPLG